MTICKDCGHPIRDRSTNPEHPWWMDSNASPFCPGTKDRHVPAAEPTRYSGMTIEDDAVRQVLLWLVERTEHNTPLSPSAMPPMRIAMCATCGHDVSHHDEEVTLSPCTYPRGLGAPATLCDCDSFSGG